MTRPGVRVIHVAAALETFERPVGYVQSYIVTCHCGWKSKRTSDWRRSLDSHFYRENAKKQESQ